MLLNDATTSHIGKARLGSALWCVSKVASNIVNVEADVMAETMRHKEESNSLLHHLIDVTSNETKFNKSLEDDSLRSLVAFDPIDTWFENGEDVTGRLKNKIVNLSLLLGKFTINWERDSNIRAVMMERVALVSKHRLAVDERPIVILVVQGGSCRPTATD